MKKKLPISIFELVVYTLSGLMGLWGLTYIALGVTCEFINYKTDLAVADAYLKGGTGNMGFLFQGFLVLGIAVLVAVVVLLINAKKSDRDFEKAQRRAARLSKENNVVDVEAQPVEE